MKNNNKRETYLKPNFISAAISNNIFEIYIQWGVQEQIETLIRININRDILSVDLLTNLKVIKDQSDRDYVIIIK